MVSALIKQHQVGEDDTVNVFFFFFFFERATSIVGCKHLFIKIDQF